MKQESSDIEKEFSLDTVLSKRKLSSVSIAILSSLYYLSSPNDDGMLAIPEFFQTIHTGIPTTLLPLLKPPWHSLINVSSNSTQTARLS